MNPAVENEKRNMRTSLIVNVWMDKSSMGLKPRPEGLDCFRFFCECSVHFTVRLHLYAMSMHGEITVRT